MTIVTGISFAILSVTVHGMLMTRRTRDNMMAFNLAESGAEVGLRWLCDQPAPPSGTNAIDPFGGWKTLSDGKYKVTLTPDPNNSGAILKRYLISSTGKFSLGTQTVDLHVRQTSFGKYAYFTDREVSSVSGGRIWFYSGDRIRGPAHSNNDQGSDFQINWGNPGSAIFEDVVTSVATDVEYQPADPKNETEFMKIYKSGSRGFFLGVDVIPLPSSSDLQRDVAWGASTGFPTTTGVYTQPMGGIYIRGDSTVTLSVNGSGQQVFTIVQGTKTTAITIDLPNNRMLKQVNGGSITTVSGAGTGVIYADGHITKLSGTVADNVLSTTTPKTVMYRNAYTIATNVVGGKNIVIPSALKNKTSYDPALSLDHDTNMKCGTLGLIGRNVKVEVGAPTSMRIDAIILAGSSTTSDGSFHVSDYNTKSPTGTLKVVGGIIQKARGPVGLLSGSTLAYGYAKDYWYDARLADNPPPYFPTTGGYDRLSWQRWGGAYGS